MSRFNLALRMLWRDSRSGELTHTDSGVNHCGHQFNGDCPVCRSSATHHDHSDGRIFGRRSGHRQALHPLPADWLAKAMQLNLTQAQTAEFSSVLIENDEMLLAGIKAVSDAIRYAVF